MGHMMSYFFYGKKHFFQFFKWISVVPNEFWIELIPLSEAQEGYAHNEV